MSFSVGLYQDFARKGGVTFNSLPATQSCDYVSEPDGILSWDEAEHVSLQLGRTPVICQGVVGEYVCRQEEINIGASGEEAQIRIVSTIHQNQPERSTLCPN